MINEFSLFASMEKIWTDHIILIVGYIMVLLLSGYIVFKKYFAEKIDRFFLPLFTITTSVTLILISTLTHLSNLYGEKLIYNFIDNPFKAQPVPLFQLICYFLSAINVFSFLYSFMNSVIANKISSTLFIVFFNLLSVLLLAYIIYYLVGIAIGLIILTLFTLFFGSANARSSFSYTLSSNSTPEDLVSHGLAGDLYQAKRILNEKYGKYP